MTGPELSAFPPVTIESIDEVWKLLTSISMPRKTSPMDVLPASLLKDCADGFALAITRLTNLSLQSGRYPKRFKSAQVLLLLKKAGLDRPANYRPISNLSTVSKALETRGGMPATPPHQLHELQSAAVSLQALVWGCRQHSRLRRRCSMSLRTSTLQVIVLIGLYLSAAFNTVCHCVRQCLNRRSCGLGWCVW